MGICRQLGIAAIAMAFVPTPTRAEVDLAQFRSCVENHASEGTPAAECVHGAQAECFGFQPESQSASAVLCFVEAQKAWSEGIRTRMGEFAIDTEEKLRSIAAIEVKYDLLTNLLQCDRMNELSLLTDADSAVIGVQKARCEATATGLALTKLLLQSRQRK